MQLAACAFVTPVPLSLVRTAPIARHAGPPLPGNTRTVSAIAPVPTVSGGRNVVVLGAGIIGLTTAIQLAKNGHAVTVVAQQTPATVLGKVGSGTYTSIGSGGFWMPVLLDGRELQPWASRTYHRLMEEVPRNGVSAHDGLLLYARQDPTLLWYAEMTKMSIVSPRDDNRIPSMYHAALQFKTVIVRMDDYLPYLQKQLEQLQVPIILTSTLQHQFGETLWDLERTRKFAAATYGKDGRPIIVNCAGIGASHASSELLQPGRGVTARIKRPTDKNYFITEDEEDGFHSDGLMAYALPRGPEYTLGGTIFRGDWRETCTPDEISGVLDRSLALLKLNRSDVEVTNTWAGLRPITVDSRARVAFLPHDGDDVIGNFGHGGSGVTLCWGCADHVVELVRQMST